MAVADGGNIVDAAALNVAQADAPEDDLAQHFQAKWKAELKLLHDMEITSGTLQSKGFPRLPVEDFASFNADARGFLVKKFLRPLTDDNADRHVWWADVKTMTKEEAQSIDKDQLLEKMSTKSIIEKRMSSKWAAFLHNWKTLGFSNFSNCFPMVFQFSLGFSNLSN